MGNTKHPSHHLFLLIITLFLAAAFLVQGIKESRVQIAPYDDHQTLSFKDGWKRLLIGSVAPVCTYNECRGCKFRCIAEQVPIEGNDPINSAYYYKCVCHR
ncbi:stomagen [Perilla frutescens var. frutescens]|nr:stomagen [Perilla frutescens var. frutescens]